VCSIKLKLYNIEGETMDNLKQLTNEEIINLIKKRRSRSS
jgi:hypothetical protein